MGLQLNVESWIWYALAMFFVVCRILSRTILFGNLTHLKIDDWLMVLTIAPYTVLIVTINIVSHTSSNLLEPGTDIDNMSHSDRDERIYGSKLILVVEQMQISTIWLVKVCLLILYFRLTQNLPAHVYVKALIAYVAFGYCLMEILYFGVWCRPFHDYWALPTPSIQCSAATDHLIVNAVFNLSSDVAMLAIASTLFIRTKLPWNRRIIVFGIFGLGIFVVLAAVLNKYYSFSHPFGSEWTFWYVRESSTAILVANVPFFWTLLRRIFKLDAFSGDNSAARTVPYHSSRSARGRHAHSPRHSRSQNGTVITANGVTKEKKGSQTSSMDVKQNGPASPLKSEPKSPTKPSHMLHKPSWREQGVFNRADQELMADIDPWDIGADHDLELGIPSSPATTRASANVVGGSSHRQSISHSMSSATSSTPRRDGASSPGGRRLRDSERQQKMQEDMGGKPQYYTGPPDSEPEEEAEDIIHEGNEGDFDGMDMEFQTSALEPGPEPTEQPPLSTPQNGDMSDNGTSRDEPKPQVRRSSGSTDMKRRSFVNKIAPSLWS